MDKFFEQVAKASISICLSLIHYEKATRTRVSHPPTFCNACLHSYHRVSNNYYFIPCSAVHTYSTVHSYCVNVLEMNKLWNQKQLKIADLESPQKHFTENRNTDTIFKQLRWGTTKLCNYPICSYEILKLYKKVFKSNQINRCQSFTVKAGVEEEWIKDEDGGRQCPCLELLPPEPVAQLLEWLLNFFLSPP